MKNNMKIYIGAVYTWSLHAFCNINPIAQNTSGGGLGHIPDELDMCNCIWLLNPHMWILLLPKCKNNKRVKPCYRLYDILVRFIYSAGIEDQIYIHFVKIYVAKCKWKRLIKSDRYQIRENTWRAGVNRPIYDKKYYYKLG